MSSLISRGAVLTVSRLSNFGLQLLSPLLLVRLLEPDAYGQYQEFMIYATLLSVICGFSINSSLTYFLPLHPDREKQLISQTTLVALLLSGVCALALLASRTALLNFISYDFVTPLVIYILLFVNMDWLEPYWLAMRRVNLVFVYSAARLAIRVSVLLLAAYLTRDVTAILWSLVVVEAVRVLACATYFARSGLLTADIRLHDIKEQMRFCAPLWATAATQQAGRDIGKLAVGALLGPVALAYYAIGSYMIPIVRVMRGAIADVVFPELVRTRDSPDGALRLWQRTNVLYCVMLFPLFALTIFYAELFVTTVFTGAYRPATPVFQIYAFFLLRRCFNIDVLLRIRGRTGFMFFGATVALALNVGLIYVLFPFFGLLGPAIAFLVAEVAIEFYYARLAIRTLGLTPGTLADWSGITRVIAGCFAGIPILLSIEHLLPLPALVRACVACAAYAGTSWYFAYRLGVTDIGRVAAWASGAISRRSRA